MDRETVKTKLLEVLAKIQAGIKKPWPTLDGSTRPLDLPGFDSKLWTPAIVMLGTALGVALPNDENIFERDRRALTVDEVAQRVVELVAGRAAAQPRGESSDTP